MKEIIKNLLITGNILLLLLVIFFVGFGVGAYWVVEKNVEVLNLVWTVSGTLLAEGAVIETQSIQSCQELFKTGVMNNRGYLNKNPFLGNFTQYCETKEYWVNHTDYKNSIAFSENAQIWGNIL